MELNDVEGGIGAAKFALNQLHSYLSNNGYGQVIYFFTITRASYFLGLFYAVIKS